MLKNLVLNNVGPADEMTLEFGDRLNILTGDNGLGKSFLLDIIWWVLTRTWPAEVNPDLTAGKKAIPHRKKTGKIEYEFTGKSKSEDFSSKYRPATQSWTRREGRPTNPGLVLYAMSDGSFAVWDPARNYWKNPKSEKIQSGPAAYVFSPKEVWDGLETEDGKWLCNGLIRDWANWQKEDKIDFGNLKVLLKSLSPTIGEIIAPGPLTRIDLNDVRDMPTLRMPYAQDVAIVHASSGMRRIIALAYFLLWVWKEHRLAAQLIREKPSQQVVFLVDEIESHLHPSWQKSIVPAVLNVMKALHKEAGVQLITATHSPLIMASIEPVFDTRLDSWFDLDLMDKKAVLTKRDFQNHGDADRWLMSEAFDLKSSRAIEFEKLVAEATSLVKEESKPKLSEIKKMNDELAKALDPTDSFLTCWQHICRAKGWLK